MSKIRIKNFGPIKEGYQENDGWMDVKKVTVFIGNQGSGKSTVAKVISTLTWLEKAICRGDVDKNMHKAKFYEFFEYQRIKNYFKEDTLIEYEGEFVSVRYSNLIQWPDIILKNKKYSIPKIMYVPSERNFLSVIENANNIKRLPGPLFTFAVEFKNGQNEFKDKEILLPINEKNEVDKISYKYDEKKEASILIGKDYEVNLLEASSGYQSLVPLFIVSKFLTDELLKGNKILREQLSVTQSIRRNEEIASIMLNEELNDREKKKKVKEIDAKYLNVCFINIVEEPEQNLFPTSQWEMLKSLLKLNNINKENKLIMTTHSPYIINYLSIAIQGKYLFDKIMNSDRKSGLYLALLNKIIPLKSVVSSSDVIIYQLEEKDGSISKLSSFEGIPSDKNYLNQSLAHGNQQFDSLLEIEQEL